MPDVREKLVELLRGVQYLGGLEEKIADHLIANGVTIQRWIPVEERLPEEWEDVLVWSKYGFWEVAVYLGIPGKWRVLWNHDMVDEHIITHWLPLPEPPKEE